MRKLMRLSKQKTYSFDFFRQIEKLRKCELLTEKQVHQLCDKACEILIQER
jgi:hypothetical protein